MYINKNLLSKKSYDCRKFQTTFILKKINAKCSSDVTTFKQHRIKFTATIEIKRKIY